MSDFPITIYHNQNCGTSRNALAMIRTAGYSPTVVEYLTAGRLDASPARKAATGDACSPA